MPAAYTRSTVAGKFPQPVINPDSRQRAQLCEAATGLPVTPIFQSRYATNEAEYRNVKLPGDSGPRTTDPRPRTSELNSTVRPPPSDFRLLAELLAGSRLDGTGGWKPLELSEIVARWNELQMLGTAKEGKR